MAYNFKETMNKPERLAPGHRMCAGCGATYFADFMKETRQSSVMQPDVWKYLHLHTHMYHGKTATSTMHLKMQDLP